MSAQRRGMSRRAFLRGAGGAALALPLLTSWPRRARAADPPPVFPKRLVIMFSPNGTVKRNWVPTGTPTSWELSPILAPLAPHKEQLVVLEGINMGTARNGPGDGHQTGMGHMLTAQELLPGDLSLIHI